MPTITETISVPISSELKARIIGAANGEGRSLANLVRLILAEWLDKKDAGNGRVG